MAVHVASGWPGKVLLDREGDRIRSDSVGGDLNGHHAGARKPCGDLDIDLILAWEVALRTRMEDRRAYAADRHTHRLTVGARGRNFRRSRRNVPRYLEIDLARRDVTQRRAEGLPAESVMVTEQPSNVVGSGRDVAPGVPVASPLPLIVAKESGAMALAE